ncbi:MAG: cytochrome c oxidase subunit 3 [Chitinophagaceae bacterium]|nr:cytochrome c oxidase subunit 3 [Chitinophagaceae bacterium]
MSIVAMEQRNKIHPHKFNMWMAIGSIMMMFAGFTSAFIIKRNQADWVSFELPNAFWISTVVIVLSSFTIWLALQAFNSRQMNRYRLLMAATFVMGLLFIVLQIIGFKEMWAKGHTLSANISYQFLYVIIGIHAVHVFGGVVALLLTFIKALGSRVKNYNRVPVQLVSTYWHFVDILWIYLLIFLLMIK